jgi:periplasmic divalent cation tolerance protein
MSAVVVHCSCPDADVASRIAYALVDEQLAACVQALPGVTSTYRWQGEVQVDTETLLLIKTKLARIDALARRVAELHPYDTPELLVLEVVDGTPDYLAWLEAATTATTPR